MDSFTQLVLGASVTEATMQNKVGRKATLWGVVLGTLPDMDVYIPLGNAVKQFTFHRAESHAFFYMLLATPLLAWLIMKIHPKTKAHKTRWLVAIFLALATHALLDSFTVYGTQLFLPFSNYPVGWSTVFIVDPAYTIPLLSGVVMLFIFRKRPILGLKLNRIGLIISCLYLVWSVGAKTHVSNVAAKSFANQNIEVSKTLVGPTPFNTLLWRVVGMTDSGYVEGYYSLLDKSRDIKFHHHVSENELLTPIADGWNVQRLQWFTRGFYKVDNIEDTVVIADIRMGAGNLYFFRFAVGEKNEQEVNVIKVKKIGMGEVNRSELLNGVWARIWDEDVELFKKD